MQTAGNGHFLAKTGIFNAFEEGIKMRVVIKFFGDRILSLLDRALYSSASYVRDLKINEYSRKEILPQKITPFHLPSCLGILSYLFELNVEKDEALRTRIMKCITKTVTLAKDRVQLHVDLVEYLPELSNFARSANAARKLEIVRLYLIFASEVGHGIEL